MVKFGRTFDCSVSQIFLRKIRRVLRFFRNFKESMESTRMVSSGGYEIELRNRVTQNDVTLQVTNSRIFIEIHFSSY